MSAGAVRNAARSFAAAYAHEDGTELTRLLTADVQRVTPGSRQVGRRAVVTAYRRQFSRNTTRGFTLSNLQVTGGAAGRAVARYRATYANISDVRGRLVLRVISDHGRARIALIVATPD